MNKNIKISQKPIAKATQECLMEHSLGKNQKSIDYFRRKLIFVDLALVSRLGLCRIFSDLDPCPIETPAKLGVGMLGQRNFRFKTLGYKSVFHVL